MTMNIQPVPLQRKMVEKVDQLPLEIPSHMQDAGQE